MSAYRDDLVALSARQQALAAEVADKTRQLEATTRSLEEVRARARLPVLDNIRIASPCPADWEQMRGDDRVRACDQCQKNVYNLSELTRDEAEALIIEKNGDLCGTYYQRKDGTILLKDCEIGVARNRKRKVIAAGAAAFLGGAAGLFALAHRSLNEVEHRQVSGTIITEPAEPTPPVEVVEADRGDDVHQMIGGYISTPESQAADLQRQLDALHQQREDLGQTIRNIEWERARLLRNQAPKPRKPLKISKAPSGPASAEPAEPTLEQLWNQEK